MTARANKAYQSSYGAGDELDEEEDVEGERGDAMERAVAVGLRRQLGGAREAHELDEHGLLATFVTTELLCVRADARAG